MSKSEKLYLNFPYKIEELHWNENHTRNKENIYCYCGKNIKENESFIKCQKCGQLFHSKCIKTLKQPHLFGDVYYYFKCSVCNKGKEIYKRNDISWITCLYLVIYNIVKSRKDNNINKNIEKNYYCRFKEDICNYIDNNWEYFFPNKFRPLEWVNIINNTLLSNPTIFISETKNCWTLKSFDIIEFEKRNNNPMKKKNLLDIYDDKKYEHLPINLKKKRRILSETENINTNEQEKEIQKNEKEQDKNNLFDYKTLNDLNDNISSKTSEDQLSNATFTISSSELTSLSEIDQYLSNSSDGEYMELINKELMKEERINLNDNIKSNIDSYNNKYNINKKDIYKFNTKNGVKNDLKLNENQKNDKNNKNKSKKEYERKKENKNLPGLYKEDKNTIENTSLPGLNKADCVKVEIENLPMLNKNNIEVENKGDSILTEKYEILIKDKEKLKQNENRLDNEKIFKEYKNIIEKNEKIKIIKRNNNKLENKMENKLIKIDSNKIDNYKITSEEKNELFEKDNNKEENIREPGINKNCIKLENKNENSELIKNSNNKMETDIKRLNKEQNNNSKVKTDVIKNSEIKNDNIKNNNIKNDDIKNDDIKNDKIKNDKIKNDNIMNDDIKNDNIMNDNIKNNDIINDDIENGDIENGNIENGDIKNNDIKNNDIKNNDIKNNDIKNNDIKNNEKKNNDIKNNDIKNNDIKNNDIKNNDIKNNDIKNNDIKNNDIKNNDIKNNDIKNNDIKNNDIKNNDIKNNDIRINDIKINYIKNDDILNKIILIKEELITSEKARAIENNQNQNLKQDNLFIKSFDKITENNKDLSIEDSNTYFNKEKNEITNIMNIKGKKENNKNTERIINQNNIIKSKDSFNSQLASESTTSSSYTLSSRSISDSLSSKTDITDEFIISSSHNKINNNADLYKYISSINTSSQINENEINSKNILNSKESDIFIYKNEQNKLLNNELQENQKKQFKNNSNDYTIKNKINNQIYFSLQKQKINDLEEKEYSKVRSSNILSHQVNRGKNDTIIDKNQENNINKIKSDNNDYNNNNNSNNLNCNNNKDNKDNNIIFNYTYNENKNNDNQFSISEESSSEMTFELERNSFKHTVDYSESDTDFSSKSSDSFKNSNENISNKGLSHPIRGGKGKQPRKGKGFYSGSKSVLQTNNTKFDEYQSDYESISDDSFNEDLNENKIKKLKDIPIINLEKENSVMKQLKIHLSSSKIARRIYRKLQIRKIKRTTQTPIFNIDRYMKNYLASKVELSPISNIKFKRYQIISVKKTEYKNSFKYRLFGKSLDYKHSLDIPIISKYTGIKLMPYIYRNYDMKPPKLKLLEDIVTYYNRNNPKWIKPKSSPIDFVHLQKEHVNTVNEMLCQAFWPGINVSEQLMFPDFSIIAMYKHLIIGCAFITPEAYITYIYVRPEWGNSGIGKFMLYYLIQSCIGKDITLHVSANNKAMLLYQKFGFKAEEFNMNFYEKYLPADSIECKNAFLLRLRR